MEQYKITEKDQNQRLDKVLASQYEDLSRVAVQKMIEEGNLLVNGLPAKASYKVKKDDRITFEQPKPKNIDLEAEDIPLDIIYEDEDLIVVNKAKGMVVHPGCGQENHTLVNALMARCKDSLSGIGGEIRPGIVHRLDKDTSGIILVAKNDFTHIHLAEQIKNRQTKKYYIALVRGNIPENHATIRMPIGRSTKDRKKMAVSEKGKEAITHFWVLKRYPGYTLLKIKIDTGRTHQIRVHMAEIGYPIVGDEVYSNGKNPFGVRGQMLHAQRIEFEHPRTKKKMALEAKLPAYFQKILERLEAEERENR